MALGKGFLPVFSESCWFLSHFAQNNVLICFLLSYAIFSIMFLRTGSSLSSYVNCTFDPLSYLKHVLACCYEIGSFGHFVTKKNSDFVFRCLIPFFGPHSSENTFLFAGNKTALLWALYYEKKCFCFFVAKTRCTRLYSTNNMFWFVCCNIGLLDQKRVFFEYAASHPDFHLILLKQRFCFLLAKLRCLTIVFLRTTLFSVSVTKLHFTLPNKCFGLLATKLGYLEP